MSPSLENPARSLFYSEKVCESWKQYLTKDANDNRARQSLGDCLRTVAESRLKMNAAQAIPEARLAYEYLRQANANDQTDTFRCPGCSMIFALALLAHRQAVEARVETESAVNAFCLKAAAKPESLEARASLAFALIVRARAETALHDVDSARHSADEAAHLATPMAA